MSILRYDCGYELMMTSGTFESTTSMPTTSTCRTTSPRISGISTDSLLENVKIAKYLLIKAEFLIFHFRCM